MQLDRIVRRNPDRVVDNENLGCYLVKKIWKSFQDLRDQINKMYQAFRVLKNEKFLVEILSIMLKVVGG